MALCKCRAFTKIIKPTVTTISKHNYSVQNACSDAENEAPKKINLEDKIAVITGGGSGIGYAIAKQFLKDGMSSLTIVDNDKQKSLEGVEKLIKEFGEEKVLFMEGDVTDSQQMDSAFRNTVLHYETIDIIVNNAGVMDDVHWESQIKTNLNGCVIGTLLGMQYMAKSSSGDGGIIVNIGSIMSVIPSSGFPIYTMTQFGIAGKYNKYINRCVAQNPKNVAKGLVDILEKAKPGSIWVAENDGEPYEVKFPSTE
ncbi:hypothetical protein NQ314_018121 [Rhamnusium bicolor]|uniref:Uncharacterized protein n=1 Tax=Rhamnusium bicolor TaxID=1586634 RepID=A0AAV8WSL9_9CUCU|nr:hypothetical protein NQ314_018121 [Rhamnusium bicolor]